MSSAAASVERTSRSGGSVSGRRRVRTILELVAAGVIAAIWLGAIFQFAVRDGAPGDFSAFYCAGRILLEHGPAALYDHGTMADLQARYFPGSTPILPWIRPPFFALVVAPLAVLPPRAALLTWLVINALALGLSVVLVSAATGVRLSVVAWHAAIFFPALAAFFNRQDAALLLAPVAAAYILLARGRHFSAGLVLAASLIKFHLLLLVPLAFLVKKNKRALAGLATGAAVLTLISLLMVGPAGLLDYVRILSERSVPNMENHPQRFVNLANLAGGLGLWAQLPLTLLAIGAVVAAARRLPHRQALAAAWLGSLMVAPHVVISDYLLALPACLLLAPLSRTCFLASLVLLFPFIPLMLVFGERWVLVAVAASLICLIGAALPRRARA